MSLGREVVLGAAVLNTPGRKDKKKKKGTGRKTKKKLYIFLYRRKLASWDENKCPRHGTLGIVRHTSNGATFQGFFHILATGSIALPTRPICIIAIVMFSRNDV
jgi:hypothetical protein